MRFVVVGHTEWVHFARVARMPLAGEIVHTSDDWEEAAGGGPVTAMQLLRLGADVEFHTALGDDELGQRAADQFRAQGLRTRVQWRGEPTRRAFTHVDGDGERTITVLGEKLLARGPLHLEADACFFVSGEPAALRSARATPASSRRRRARRRPCARPTCRSTCWSRARTTRASGRRGSRLRTSCSRPAPPAAPPTVARYPPAPVPGPVADAYGCGDSFAAALAFALARGDALDDALALAARAGAAVLTGRGAFAGQIDA